MIAEVRAYSPEFDQAAYSRLVSIPNEVREQEKERLDLYTDKQLQTLLAERYNVLVNPYYYEMHDGQLWGENMNEPALESFKRGRDYRRENGNPIDFDREEAEILGFEKIQKMLSEEKDVLLISPQGGQDSTYQHNFYDIFRWRDGRVESKRYSSALSIEEYQKLLRVDFETDDQFLSNPIDISNLGFSPEEIHEYLHKDHEYMDENFFNTRILVETISFRMGYIEAQISGDKYLQSLNFNAMLNVADELSDRYKNSSENHIEVLINYSFNALFEYGNKQVREVSAGCGSSGGMKLGKSSFWELSGPFSVKEFGEESGECAECGFSSADKHYHCPDCKREYKDETSKSANERTKKCNCGFKFGC